MQNMRDDIRELKGKVKVLWLFHCLDVTAFLLTIILKLIENLISQ